MWWNYPSIMYKSNEKYKSNKIYVGLETDPTLLKMTKTNPTNFFENRRVVNKSDENV